MDTTLTYIHAGHHKISSAYASKLLRESGAPTLKKGYERRVTLENGDKGWLLRTPYRFYKDSPKRGWVWAVHGLDSSLKFKPLNRIEEKYRNRGLCANCCGKVDSQD